MELPQLSGATAQIAPSNQLVKVFQSSLKESERMGTHISRRNIFNCDLKGADSVGQTLLKIMVCSLPKWNEQLKR